MLSDWWKVGYKSRRRDAVIIRAYQTPTEEVSSTVLSSLDSEDVVMKVAFLAVIVVVLGLQGSVVNGYGLPILGGDLLTNLSILLGRTVAQVTELLAWLLTAVTGGVQDDCNENYPDKQCTVLSAEVDANQVYLIEIT
jgi:hypothetical protein